MVPTLLLLTIYPMHHGNRKSESSLASNQQHEGPGAQSWTRFMDEVLGENWKEKESSDWPANNWHLLFFHLLGCLFSANWVVVSCCELLLAVVSFVSCCELVARRNVVVRGHRWQLRVQLIVFQHFLLCSTHTRTSTLRGLTWNHWPTGSVN